MKRYRILFQSGGYIDHRFSFWGHETNGFDTEQDAIDFIQNNKHYLTVPENGFHLIIVPVITIYKDNDNYTSIDPKSLK